MAMGPVNTGNGVAIQTGGYTWFVDTDEVMATDSNGKGTQLLPKTNQGKTNWTFSIGNGKGSCTEDVLPDGTRAVRFETTTEATNYALALFNPGKSVLERLQPNTVYTLSFDALSNVRRSGSVAISTTSFKELLTGSRTWSVDGDEQWHKITMKLTTNDLTQPITSQGIYLAKFTAVGYTIIKNLKLEIGDNENPTWSPEGYSRICGSLADCMTDKYRNTWFYVKTTYAEDGLSHYPEQYSIDGLDGLMPIGDYVVWTGFDLIHVPVDSNVSTAPVVLKFAHSAIFNGPNNPPFSGFSLDVEDETCLIARPYNVPDNFVLSVGDPVIIEFEDNPLESFSNVSRIKIRVGEVIYNFNGDNRSGIPSSGAFALYCCYKDSNSELGNHIVPQETKMNNENVLRNFQENYLSEGKYELYYKDARIVFKDDDIFNFCILQPVVPLYYSESTDYVYITGGMIGSLDFMLTSLSGVNSVVPLSEGRETILSFEVQATDSTIVISKTGSTTEGHSITIGISMQNNKLTVGSLEGPSQSTTIVLGTVRYTGGAMTFEPVTPHLSKI